MSRDHHGEAEVPPLGRQEDEACDRFEAAWLAGAHPRIEDYLPDVAGPEPDSFLRELLVLELAYRRRDGERPNQREYAARFPGHDALIAPLFGAADIPAEERDRTLPAMPCPTVGVAAGEKPTKLTLEVLEGPHKPAVRSCSVWFSGMREAGKMEG
jgi:hypothetical protein